ncbi:RsmD family RNA methyltransferase [Synechococcus lacustris Tous-12m]
MARPTLALVREAVMNSLRPQIPGSRWLDLCSGSGAMACEALLHGAAFVQLVEENRRIAAVARSNLEALGDAYRNKWQLAVSDVDRWLNSRRNPAKTEIFSLIYGDPPIDRIFMDQLPKPSMPVTGLRQREGCCWNAPGMKHQAAKHPG